MSVGTARAGLEAGVGNGGADGFVRPFAALGRGDVGFAGGKGANLGELTAAGLPVPPGFVIGAPAYASHRDGSGLRERIAARLAGVDLDDTAALELAADGLRREIELAPIPGQVASDFLAARLVYRLLGLALRGRD